jgi:hypothetical protein
MWMLHMLPWIYTYVGSVLFQMFHLFQTHVASVLSGCCTYFTHMLQVFHLSMLHISHICCKCLISMLHMFCNGYTRVFLVLQVFQLFWTQVASVSSRCCKSRSILHMLQWNPSAVAACWTRMHARGCGGARAADAGNGVGADRDAAPTSARAGVGNGAARESEC